MIHLAALSAGRMGGTVFSKRPTTTDSADSEDPRRRRGSVRAVDRSVEATPGLRPTVPPSAAPAPASGFLLTSGAATPRIADLGELGLMSALLVIIVGITLGSDDSGPSPTHLAM